MASSRKPRRKADPDDARLLAALRTGVAEARTARGRDPGPLAIAYSGGADSTALLDAACELRVARARGFARLLAVHVHHGLLPQADAWAEHCRAACERWQVPFELRRVQVRRGANVEAAAREARYAALAQAALAAGCRFVLTAHHLDDRIETFLLQWLRGAGPDGLAGMPAAREFADGKLVLLRPWLDFTREQLRARVARRGLEFAEDPSNADTRLARNALRLQVLPRFAELRKGYREAAARSIDLIAASAVVLKEVAAADLAACGAGAPQGMLRLDSLAQLTRERRAAVVRAWLAQHGLIVPSRAKLTELLDQALHARADARILVRIGGHEVRRHRGLLLVRRPSGARRDDVEIRWQGEAQIPVAAWGGRLHFEPADEGFDADWLRAATLHLRGRGGGERFKPHPTRPSKTLKRLFQDAGIAEFARASLPLVWRAERLIYVGGLGPDVRLIEAEPGRVALRWEPDAALIES